jgi:hypothetical protein
MSNVKTNTVARKSIVRAQDVALSFLMGGVAAVQKLHNEKGFTAATLDSAIETMRDGGQTVVDLLFLREKLFTKSTGVRGRKAAQVGDSRVYSVQEVGETGAFVRLPVGLLGLAKGDDVRVDFLDGRIVVTVATA